MKHLSPDDRPREKLSRLGAAALGDNELLALVLGNGSRHRDALAVATALLAAYDGLHGLLRASCDDLMRATGIGRARAAQIIGAIELGRRTLARAPSERPRLVAPHEAAAYLMPRFGSYGVEQFGIILLDAKSRVMRTTVLAVGTQNSTIVEPREVFREATRGGAASIVVFHSHPSGDPTPSPEDVALTKRLAAAGALMGIEVVDHVVLGDGRYCSFRESARL
jgi:DNA repair protein RadC